jgi:hypothetical protein
LHAQLGVEVRQRLVEQEDLWVAHDGAAHGDALPLTARELARLAIAATAPGRESWPPVRLRSSISDFGAFANVSAEG